MATNTYLTNSMISNEALRVLTNSLQFTKLVKRQFEGEFGKPGMKLGDTYNIRRPVQYRYSTGPVLDLQSATETSVPLALTNWMQRGLAFETKDLTLSIDMFSDRFIKPAMISGANQIDKTNLEQAYKYVADAVGTAGTNPSSQTGYNTLVTDANVRLFNNLMDSAEIPSLLCTPAFAQAGQGFNVNVFNPTGVISGANVAGFINSGFLGHDWYRSQIMPRHTVGVYSGTPVVNGAGQSGSTINTSGWGGSTTLNVGDVVTFDGVFAVNAQTKQVYAHLQQFVITAKNAAGASQALQISPALYGPEAGAQQNVSKLPDNNAAVVVLGASGSTYGQQLSFSQDAFTAAFVDFEMPAAGMGVVVTKSADPETGVSLTYTKGYDIVNFREIHRIDSLSGIAATYPQLAVRVVGGSF